MTRNIHTRIVLPALIVLAGLLLVLGAVERPAFASCDSHPLVVHAACPPPASSESPSEADVGAPVNLGPATAFTPRPAGTDNLSGLQAALLSGSSMRYPSISLAPLASPLRWPVFGPITQPFGVPELGVGLPHAGLDIGLDAGSPVRAARAGRVIFAGGDPCCGLGYWVEINHGDHYSTRYGHFMRPPTVLAGDYVSEGQVLGFSGNTGFSTGPHLHFEVRQDGVPIDPFRVLTPR